MAVCLSGLIISGSVLPNVAKASEADIHIVTTEQSASRSLKEITGNNEVYRGKTPQERSQLPADERALVEALEDYIKSQVNLNSRSITELLLNRLLVDFAFDFGFNRDNQVFATLASAGSAGGEDIFGPYVEWFDKLGNKELRTMTVYDKPTKKNVSVNSYYIDNGSETTIAIHHGYRGDYVSMLPQVQFFSELGYNIILVDARGHGSSEGKFITFGMNESQDLNTWVAKEVEGKPEQNVYLYGVSMGAATVMMSQEKPQPNVKAVIEDCGYSSVEQQFRDMLRMISKATQYIPILNQINWYAKEDTLLNLLNDQHLKPKLEMDLFAVSPLESTKVSGVPALYIHGESDTFIPPVAKDLLYTAAIGYKEQLGIPGAEHGISFFVDNSKYKAKVIAFMETVENLKTKGPIVASDLNLLENNDFTGKEGGFESWLTALNSQSLSNRQLPQNNYGEFVLEKKWLKDYATFVKYGEGVRFYNRGYSGTGYIGQEVSVVAGQTYELSVTAKNTSATLFAYPNVVLSAGDKVATIPLKNRSQMTPKINFKATTDQSLAIKVGSNVGNSSLLGLATTHTQVANLIVVNADRTPPEALSNISTSQSGSQVTISGRGEANTTVILLNDQQIIIGQVTTDGNGAFQLTASLQKGQFHLMNQDVKGNCSQSTLIVVQ